MKAVVEIHRLLNCVDVATPVSGAESPPSRGTEGRPPARVWDRFARNLPALDTPETRRQIIVGTLAIFVLVFIAFLPLLPGSFLMDDWKLIQTDNALVNGQLHPLTFWFQTDFTLTTFVFWLEWLAWGAHAGWYHVVSMALHATSGVLLWRLLARLKIPGAWVAGAAFAIHPVCVNSVARIGELKNTLSLPFFLLSFYAYLRYDRAVLYPAEAGGAVSESPRSRATLWYVCGIVSFLLALLAKTSTVMLPVCLLACAAWQRGRLTRRDLIHTAPYFVLALGFGVMSTWFQKHQALVGETLAPESFWQRLALAGHIFWFYLSKAVFPLNLNLVYSLWKVNVAAPVAYLWDVLFVAGLALCWHFRRGWGRHALFGLGCFAITLFPALGFFDAQFLTRVQVSDHLQYLPLAPPVSLVVAALAALLPGLIFRCAAPALLLAFAVLTFQRAEVFRTDESLLRDTLAKNSGAWAAHNEMGVILAQRKEYGRAMEEFSESLRENPDNAAAQGNLGQTLLIQREFKEAEPHFLAALKLNPTEADTYNRLASTVAAQGRYQEAVFLLQAALHLKPDVETRMQLAALLYVTGKPGQAADQYRQVIRAQPDLPTPFNNLAWLLATCSDDKVRNGPEAVRCAEQACRLTRNQQPLMLSTLAAAYAETGRFQQAITTAEAALRLQTATGDTRSAALNQQLLARYRAGQAWREAPPRMQGR